MDGEIIVPRLHTVSPSLGIFFFRQERFVAPDSEIEVFYEYEDEDLEEEVFRGQMGWEVSETLSLGTTVFRRGGDGSGRALEIGEVYGQYRWRDAARNLDLRLIPEVAFSRAGGDSSGGAAQVHLIAAWSGLHFNGVWKEFGKDFRTIGQRELAFGAHRRIVELSSQYAIQPNLPLDLEWRREEAEDGRDVALGSLVASAFPEVRGDSRPIFRNGAMLRSMDAPIPVGSGSASFAERTSGSPALSGPIPT